VRRLAIAALFFAGCYSPSPPDGAYLCSSSDQACPSGQHCTCGQCVKKDSAAACSFTVTTPAPDGKKLDVDEHEQFALQIAAVAKDGTPATGYNGTVKLTSSWGDVNPATVQLSNGAANPMIALNRETLDPAVAVVSASAAGNSGKSGGIDVHAPCTMCSSHFAVDPDEILPTMLKPFGWAELFAAEPAIVKQGSIYTMYFLGQGTGKYGFGLATSTDGKNFTPASDPVLQGNPLLDIIYSPTVFPGGPGFYLAYGDNQGILLASSTDGKSFSPVNLGAPVLAASKMVGSYYQNQVMFPQVMADPSQPDTQVMFFSAFQQSSVSIARASSTDGVTWTPEPAPLLSSSLSGEQILLSPRVMLDGTVWKMWYSYANLADLPNCLTPGGCPAGSSCNLTTGSCQPTDAADGFFSFCQGTTRVQVGYATSADGFFWTKSTKNPALSIEEVGGGARAIVVSSVLPLDGVDGSSGNALWFSTFRKTPAQNNRCIPNGIRRATRP
jgi:hypothetical protein